MATHDVEIFVCERWKPMMGWSESNLLPTDRSAYRVRNCKKSWRSLAELEAALLAPGWVWEDVKDAEGKSVEWHVDATGQQADADGWSYALNFSSKFEGSHKAGNTNCVRWRRMLRTQNFTGTANSLLEKAAESPKGKSKNAKPSEEAAKSESEPKVAVCQNADLEVAGKVGRWLMEAVAAASLQDEWNEPALVIYKTKLLEKLAEEKQVKNASLNGKDPVQVFVTKFADSFKGVATRMAEAFSTKDAEGTTLATRIQEVHSRFPSAEREALAVIAIRKFHPESACCSHEEKHDCEFRPALCPHEGCSERCSIRALKAHDDVCPFKRLPCEKCSEEVPRAEHKVHLMKACPMREAQCCYNCIGCRVLPSHKDLEKHLEDSTQGHMMLLVRAVIEQQEISQALKARVGELEGVIGQLESSRQAQVAASAALQAQVAGLEAQLAAHEKKAAKDVKEAAEKAAEELKKRTDAIEKEAKKRVEAVETSHKKEIGALRSDLSKSTSSLAKIADVETLKADVGGIKSAMETRERIEARISSAASSGSGKELPPTASAKDPDAV